jgi:hypothetical protein
MSASKTFIRAVEVWLPDAENALLEFGGGLYGNAKRLGLVSRSMCFGRGEGLPGRAWDQGRPIVLRELDPRLFRRSEQARADGLTCGIALPIFAGDALKAVLVMFCGDDDEHVGAIELWRNDPETSREMSLDDGYYGGTADAFEFISRRTSFHKGIGLPGMAWQADAPVFMPDLGKSSRFLRADSAIKVGINRGFAFPCANRGDEHFVLAFLSALATPLVRRLEIWSPAGSDGALYLAEGFCETQGLLHADPSTGITPGQGLIGRSFATAVPMVTERALDETGPAGAAALAADCSAMASLPVLRQGRVSAVLAWYF